MKMVFFDIINDHRFVVILYNLKRDEPMYGLIKFVRQRDKTLKDFDITILENTIYTSISKSNEFNEPENVIKSTSSRITFSVISELEKKISKKELDPYNLPVDEIREIVETVFYNNGYHDTAKIYIRNEYAKIIEEYKKKIKSLEDELESKNT